MRTIPIILTIFVSTVVMIVFTLVMIASRHAGDKTNYEFIRDFVVPLTGPLIAIAVPTIFFYTIPNTQNQQKAAVDLFTNYHSEDLRIARQAAWEHFVTEPQNMHHSREKCLDDFLAYLMQPEVARSVSKSTHEIYQRASRVLDFFAMVNGCLEKGTVDDEMVRSFLAFYYQWWLEEIIVPLRKRPIPTTKYPKNLPLWWTPMKALDEACAQ